MPASPLQSVGNGVSLLPCRKITGVLWTGPEAPKPRTGVPSDVSTIVGKPAGNDVPRRRSGSVLGSTRRPTTTADSTIAAPSGSHRAIPM